MAQCSRQCSNKVSLREVIAQSLRHNAWSRALHFQNSFLVAAQLLMEMLVRLCPRSLRDEILRSNVWNILKGGLCDKANLDQLTSRSAGQVGSSAWNDKTLLVHLMVLADFGVYFHLSRLVNSPEEYQYMQVLFVLDLAINPNMSDSGDSDSGRDDDRFCLRDLRLPKLLGLPGLVSYVDIEDLVNALHDLSRDLFTFQLFFDVFQRDPARSGKFHLTPARWHAFAATRFLRFLATSYSR